MDPLSSNAVGSDRPNGERHAKPSEEQGREDSLVLRTAIHALVFEVTLAPG
jgi:hypothetical protein